MDSSKKLNYFLRRYPLLRGFIFIVVLSIIVGSFYLINNKTKPIPEITSIVPPVGSPGDVVIINGKNFGETREMSFVEFSGSKLTASSYISWSDNQIKLVLPANVQDGLVVVGTKDYRSKPSLFANEVDIPVPVTTTKQTTKPVITALSYDKLNVGDMLVILGSNFGDLRNKSKVYFTIDYNNKIEDSELKNISLLTENMVEASESDFDYISWSNGEIQVFVPDGAASGVIVVDTGSEKSEPFYFNLLQTAGKKSFINKKIYLVQYTADVADVVTNEAATITLRCPFPCSFSSQPSVEITDVRPEPVLMNYQKDLIHQIVKQKNNSTKSIFTQTFVLPVYEVQTKVNADKILNYKNTNPMLMEMALRQDSLVPSEADEIVELCHKITGKEKNPYKKAKLIYSYMCDNFKILDKTRKGDSNPLDLLSLKSGDAFDFAVIFTALLRASDIPAYTDSGVLVCQDMMTQSHWWAEFYLEDFGWIPVDPALGAGMDYKKWNEGEEILARDYYFGNLDSHHITFSRGWNQLKPFSQDNKIVQQPRSFALQSIWEEASSNTGKYSSYWSVPVVKGVY